ncbi:ATP-binding protein [Paludisphaera borealis]|uniref:ATP-binding protein n=1 Tax=Paludisphaera borealis TaxID=1387353 RepID=UPI000970F131|nr:ATP-binding protein [Paludisphaera borealis]
MRILIVEDDADTRENLRDILELDGCRVDEAVTVAATLDRQDWSTYSTILLDRKLPDGTAFDLLPRLKRLAPAADVIILTGFADVDGAISALRQGAADYLLKPINPDELKARIFRLAESRRADEELRRRSLILQSVLKQVADATIVVDRHGKVLLYSPAIERLIGSIRVGAPLEEWSARGLLHRPDADTPYALEDMPLSRALRGDEVIDEEIFVKPPGNRPSRWMSANASPLRDPEGIQGAVVILRDITERKEAQARALQSERLAAIGEMVTGLAHESRNALQRGQACLEMLALEVRDRPRAVDLVVRLQKAQDDLARLYEDVRDYASPILIRSRSCDLAEVWRKAWSDLEPARRGRKAVLREVIEIADASNLIDPSRMAQVFRNLLENSLAACVDPVEIAIRCVPDELDGHPALRISVSDNGPGFAPGQRPKAFEAFHTTKTKGTGLGLAICRRIIEAHGGRIILGSGPGRGAKFIITLPKGNP